MINQDVDSIIAEENINDSSPSVIPDEVPVTTDDTSTLDKPADEPEVPEVPEEPKGDEPEAPKPDEPKEEDKTTEPVTPKEEERSPTETIAEAKTLIQNLELTDDKIFAEDGTVRPWNDIVPAGPYLASQLEPVIVTDKEGKVHEFMLLSDVEKAFPEGFEAKNNLEQMKFERNIMSNETKFDEAIKTYEGAKSRYEQETGSLVESRASSERIGSEYKAMADQGLVPKVGDPNDPKFNESDAVKELNNIMTWMNTKNTELASKGLGKIDSLYVAKQLMDAEGNVTAKDDKKKDIINERNEVASLSANTAPGSETKRPQHHDIPMSRLADSIIAEEGLR